MIQQGTMKPGRQALCCALGLFLFLYPCFAYPGQLYMWTDKKGVTHVSDQPPKEDVELKDTIEYKEMRNVDLKRDEFKRKFDSIDRDYKRKMDDITLQSQREKNSRVDEYNKKLKQLESERKERELAEAKRRHEYLKSQEETYRKWYHNPHSQYREYWYKKMKEVDEARSEVIKLENKK